MFSLMTPNAEQWWFANNSTPKQINQIVLKTIWKHWFEFTEILSRWKRSHIFMIDNIIVALSLEQFNCYKVCLQSTKIISLIFWTIFECLEPRV